MREKSSRAGAEIIFGENAHQWAIDRAHYKGREAGLEEAAALCTEKAEAVRRQKHDALVNGDFDAFVDLSVRSLAWEEAADLIRRHATGPQQLARTR